MLVRVQAVLGMGQALVEAEGREQGSWGFLVPFPGLKLNHVFACGQPSKVAWKAVHTRGEQVGKVSAGLACLRFSEGLLLVAHDQTL